MNNYMDKIRQAAKEAEMNGDNDVATVLYCLLGFRESGVLPLFASLCQALARWDLDRINAEQKSSNWNNN